MSRRQLLLSYAAAVLLVAGAATAFRARGVRQTESPVPSIENATARGAKALFTWLSETGANPAVLRTPYTSLPAEARVLVALGPTQRRISSEEWDALLGWITRGGTFVYALPRRVRAQEVDRELGVEWIPGPRPAPLLDPGALDRGLVGLLTREGEPADPTGADAVPWTPSPLLAGVRTLRVAADDGLESRLGRVLPIAGTDDAPSILEMAVEKGRVVALAGTELAENRRIGLGDNLTFWANLAARGQVWFDEYHQRSGRSELADLARAIGPVVLQLLLGAVLFATAIGRRLGEPRPLAESRERSQSEYVEQVARLYTRAGIEGSLCGELYRSLRRGLFERLGISARLDDLEVARRLASRTRVPEEQYLRLAQLAQRAERDGSTPREFSSLAREFALLERRLGIL